MEIQTGLPLKEQTKRKKKKYKIELEQGVLGREYACYLDMTNNPTILIRFLHIKNEVYQNNIKIFVLNDKKNTPLVSDTLIELKHKLNDLELVNEIFYEVQMIMVENQKQNFEQRELNKMPLLEYKACPKDYIEYRGE